MSRLIFSASHRLQSFEEKYEAKLEFPEGWGIKPKKKVLWEGYEYFLGQHIGEISGPGSSAWYYLFTVII